MARRGRNDRVKQAARRRRIGGAALSGGALVAGQMAGIPPAHAVDYTVANLFDSGPGSLRQAIADSNATPTIDDTITFAPFSGTLYLTSGPLVITDDVVITGPPIPLFLGGVSIDADSASRVFEVYSPTELIDVTISGLGVRGGYSTDDGGGIWVYDENVTLDTMFISENQSDEDGGGVFIDGPSDAGVGHLAIVNSSIFANTAADEGGGVAVESVAAVTITGSSISTNRAANGGGGVDIDYPLSFSTIVDSTISGNTGAEGGGLSLYGALGGFTVERTTISANTSVDEAGGGMFVQHALSPVTIVESTISGNTSTGTRGGGGLALYFDATASPDVSIQHSTITANTGYGGGGVWARSSSSRIDLDHTIVAGNNGTSFGLDLAGEFNDAWSLIGNTSGATLHPVLGTQNLLNVDPLLGPLGDHGGPTPTHLPAGISPALNAGNPAFTAPPGPALDQRGMPRKLDTRIDIGSVELYPSLPGRVATSTGWSLQDALLPASATTSATISNFTLGTTPLVPLTGDWDGDGDNTPGFFKGGSFFLFNGFTTSAATNPVTPFAFGDSRGFPVAGDFDDDGADDVAVFRNGLWQVRLSAGGTTTYNLGPAVGVWPAVVPVAGDWDGGEGGDGIGVYQAGTWTLRDDVNVTNEDYSFFYRPGTTGYPVVGDWDGDGSDTVGVKVPAGTLWQVRNTNDAGPPDYQFNFGAANHLPVVWQLAENPEPSDFLFPFPIP